MVDKPEPYESIPVGVPRQRIEDLLWGHSLNSADTPWWVSMMRPKGHHYADVRADDPEGDEGNGKLRKEVYWSDVIRGLSLMARKYPRHFADWIQENDDLITCDVAWQLIVYGDIIYS